MSLAPMAAGTGMEHQGRCHFCVFKSDCLGKRLCLWRRLAWGCGFLSMESCWAPPVGRLHRLLLPPGTADIFSTGVGQEPGGQQLTWVTEFQGWWGQGPARPWKRLFSLSSQQGQIGKQSWGSALAGSLWVTWLTWSVLPEAWSGCTVDPQHSCGFLAFLTVSKDVSSQIRNFTVFG